MLACCTRLSAISARPVRAADPWESISSDDGGVGIDVSVSTRRSRDRRAGVTRVGFARAGVTRAGALAAGAGAAFRRVATRFLTGLAFRTRVFAARTGLRALRF